MGLFSKTGDWLNDPNDKGLTGFDRLEMISSALIDAGDPTGQSNRYDDLQKALGSRKDEAQKKALLDRLTGVLSGDAPPAPSAPLQAAAPVQQGPGLDGEPVGVRLPPRLAQLAQAQNGPSLQDPRTRQALMAAALGGVHGIGDITSILDKSRSKVENFNGYAVDPYATKPGAYFPKLEDGQTPLYDAAGNIVATRNLDGSVQAAAQRAGAVKGAEAAAEAPYKFQTYAGPHGEPITASASTMAGKSFKGQSPAETTYQTDAAKAQVERDFMRPKAAAALQSLDAKTKNVADAIDRALGMVDVWSAGPGAMLKGVPMTRSLDLAAQLETIKANLGFDELQAMRDNSPTGGALGQVAVQELEALRSTLASLRQDQSPAQLKAGLSRIKEIRAGAAARRQAAYQQTYGQPGAQPQHGAGGGQRGVSTTLGKAKLIAVED